MHNRIPSRRRPDTARPQPGETLPAQGDTQERSPRMPHERDESADSQTQAEPSTRRMGELAQADVEAGLVDTDRGPALDEAYQKAKR